MVNGLHALHALTSYDPQLRLVLTFYVLTQEGPWSSAPSASRWSLPWWWRSRVAWGPSPSRRRRRRRCSSRSYIGREKGAVPSNGRGTRVAVECVHLLGVRIKAKAPARGAGGRCARGPFFLAARRPDEGGSRCVWRPGCSCAAGRRAVRYIWDQRERSAKCPLHSLHTHSL